MTNVTWPPETDPTLDAMDDAMVEISRRKKRRLYLGMSSIGNECARMLWYQFRWAMNVVFKASTLRAFDDGFTQEDVAIERLRAISGVTLLTLDPASGRQIGYSDFGGHFRGHMDGDITGILQAPVTPHVWEHKSINEKKFKKLNDLKDKVGEKSALRQWDQVYYAQGVLYMEYGGYSRHYLTACTPGGRAYTSVRTNEDPNEAQNLKEKAKRIIFSDSAPERIGTPDFYKCRWCDFSEICHEGKAADRNCRTCLHAIVCEEGGWACNRSGQFISPELQEVGCEEQRYLPCLIPGTVSGGSDEGNWVEYTMPDGTTWKDEG